jgi:hypothetical protein
VEPSASAIEDGTAAELVVQQGAFLDLAVGEPKTGVAPAVGVPAENPHVCFALLSPFSPPSLSVSLSFPLSPSLSFSLSPSLSLSLPHSLAFPLPPSLRSTYSRTPTVSCMYRALPRPARCV